MRDLYSVLRGPRITEKATLLRDYGDQVVFEVDPQANKVEIKQAVEKIFKKKVISVRTINVKGKPKRVGRYLGRRSDWKKAIVRLYPGETIDFIEGV